MRPRVRRNAFDVLPHVSQMTWDGGPNRSKSWMKSLSLVRTTAPAALAAAKMLGSSASRSPSSRIGIALTPHAVTIQPASEGESCASSQIVSDAPATPAPIRRESDDRAGDSRTEGRQ